MNLRDYQLSAVESAGRCLVDGGSTLIVLPTGGGKTVVFAHIIDRFCPKRALVLAHREELIGQNARTIERVTGEPCDIERAELHADMPSLHGKRKVIVASKDSLHESRLARFNPDEFSLIITDEAHHAVADSYRRIYDYFKGVPHLGVTATPDRLDETALGNVFDTVAYRYEIADMIRDGWLVPVKAHTTIVQNLDLDRVRTTGGELNQGELAEQMERERAMHEVASTLTERAGNRRGLVFCVSVRQAQVMADQILNDYSPGCARWICGETPRDLRAQIFREHKAGEFQFLVNVGIATEGYDDPGISLVAVARPTKSRALYSQMLGRGTRTVPGLVDGIDDPDDRRAAIAGSLKPDLLVLDYTGNSSRHKLVTPADALGGKYLDEDIECVDLSEEVDVLDALERAKKRREQKEREEQDAEEVQAFGMSRHRIVAQAQYLLREEDLFDGAFAPGRERTWLGGKGPTPQQIATLEKHGFKREDVERMSHNECSKLIGGIVLRVQAGLCTIKQANLLKRFGVRNAESLSFQEARDMLDRRLAGARR